MHPCNMIPEVLLAHQKKYRVAEAHDGLGTDREKRCGTDVGITGYKGVLLWMQEVTDPQLDPQKVIPNGVVSGDLKKKGPTPRNGKNRTKWRNGTRGGNGWIGHTAVKSEKKKVSQSAHHHSRHHHSSSSISSFF